MHARTSSWTGTPEALEKWAEQMAGSIAPMVAGLPGNAGAYFFIDREDGSALTLTLWESEDAALVSDVTAEKSRESTVAATGRCANSVGGNCRKPSDQRQVPGDLSTAGARGRAPRGAAIAGRQLGVHVPTSRDGIELFA